MHFVHSHALLHLAHFTVLGLNAGLPHSMHSVHFYALLGMLPELNL